MGDNEVPAAQVATLEDRVIAALIARRENIGRLANLDPSLWTVDDINAARMMANAILGFFASGRLIAPPTPEEDQRDSGTL